MSRASGHKKKVLPIVIAGVLVSAAVAIVGVLVFMHLSANPSPSPGSEERMEDGFVEVDWDYWKSVNPDIIGWVNVDGTNIDYPIVAASKSDPDFYLKHDIYRNYNAYGVPYLDADCEGDLDAKNAVVYGHHMNNDSMFSDFANFIDRSYLEAHSPIYLQTPEKKMKLDVRYVDVVDGATASKYTTFDSLTQYLYWYEDQLEDASFVVDSESRPLHVVTFCTCSYHQFDNERTLVVASDPNTQNIIVVESEVNTSDEKEAA